MGEVDNGVQVVATVLAFNGEATIGEVLGGLRAQEPAVSRIILVDNASTDRTVEVATSLDPGLTVVRRADNDGVGAGHNAGLSEALATPGCELVWVLEHDSLVQPGCLASMLEVVGDLSGRIGVVTPMEAQTHAELEDEPSTRHHVTSAGNRGRFTFNATLFRADMLREIGLVREEFFVGHEDWDLSRRVHDAGWRIAVAPDAFIVHPTKGMRRRGESPSLLRYYYSARNGDRLELERRVGWGAPLVVARGTAGAGHKLLVGPQRLRRAAVRLIALLHALRGRMGRASTWVLRLAGAGS